MSATKYHRARNLRGERCGMSSAAARPRVVLVAAAARGEPMGRCGSNAEYDTGVNSISPSCLRRNLQRILCM